MSRDFRLYLDDVLEACEKIRLFVSEMTFEEFSNDVKTIDAVVRNLEIIGEAVKCVPIEMLSSQPQVDWRKIKQFRDIIAHHYFRVDLEVVWAIVQQRIGALEAATYAIMSDHRGFETE